MESTMKINPGFVTDKLAQTKEFYLKYFGFKVKFENDFYILLIHEQSDFEISFLETNHPSQNQVFQPKYEKGSYLTIEVPDVDSEYKKLKSLGCEILMETKDEPWGDRHFIVLDPNGLGLDIVTYKGD